MLSISRPGPKAKRALFFMASDSVVLALKKKNMFKLHIFWEGHKILRNLHCRFDSYYIGQIYSGDFAKNVDFELKAQKTCLLS